MKLQPYLFFAGRCEEAIGFYRTVFGAEPLMVMRFKESPNPVPTGTDPELIMHAAVRIGPDVVMMSDGVGSGGTGFNGFSLTLTLGETAEAERLFSALSEGGTVAAPLTETFFSPAFGMLTDRFGVGWIVTAQPT